MSNPATFHGNRNATHIGRKPAFGQTCSMRTLLQDGILQAGEKVLTLEFEGSKFCGDLRRDGTIMMRDPDDAPHIYATPVAWANHCCKMLNPESKPLNAWSSIRFKGKRLDSYKLKWYRAQKKPVQGAGGINEGGGVMNGGSSIIRNLSQTQNNLQQQNSAGASMLHNHITNHFPQYDNPIRNKKLIKSILINNNMDLDCRRLVAKSLDLSDDILRQPPAEANKNDDNNNSTNNEPSRHPVITYEQLGTRGPHNTHNQNTMVKCIPFSAVDRIQPFNVNVTTNALLLIDFHSHLVTGEVAGYLAGHWDLATHVLTIVQAFPCRTTLSNEETFTTVEEEIRQDIENKQMTVVGWYHSHQGKYSNHPTIKDIQNQMEYQITMKDSASGYTPCIGLICSPHDTRSENDLSPTFQIFWVMPPPEHLTNHYGRPMQMYYSVDRDMFLTQDLLLEMRLLSDHYNALPEKVEFKAPYQHNDKITNLEKLSASIKPKLPKDLQESEYPDEPQIWKNAIEHFWKFLKSLVVTSAKKQVQEQKSDEQVAQTSTVESVTEAEEKKEVKDEEEEQESKEVTAMEEQNNDVVEETNTSHQEGEDVKEQAEE